MNAFLSYLYLLVLQSLKVKIGSQSVGSTQRASTKRFNDKRFSSYAVVTFLNAKNPVLFKSLKYTAGDSKSS